jgi:hypothetical protein
MLRAVLATAVLATGAMFGALPEAQAQSLVPCARENGFCRVPYPTRVIYGIPCSNGAFGDPAPGVPKRCAYVARRYDRGDRWRDDGHRGPPPPRGYDRGFRDYDDGYERPVRRYNAY